jgi:hypothetical protein
MRIIPIIPNPTTEVGPTDEAWKWRENFLSRETLFVVELIGGDDVSRPGPRRFRDAASFQLAELVVLLSEQCRSVAAWRPCRKLCCDEPSRRSLQSILRFAVRGPAAGGKGRPRQSRFDYAGQHDQIKILQ